MSQCEVSIIIVSYNTKDLLRQCLASVLEHTAGSAAEIFVVDNASSDGSPEAVKTGFPGVKLIENRENLGFAKANNAALKLMKGEFALLLNSDALLKSGTLEKLTAFAGSHPTAAMIGPRLLNGDGTLQPSTYPLPALGLELLKTFKLYGLLPGSLNAKLFLGSFFDHKTSVQAGALKGACVLVRKTAMEKVGLLSEDFFFYGEVHDWCWRMLESGWQIWFCAETEAVHLGGQSSKQKWDMTGSFLVTLEAYGKMLKRHKPLFLVKLMYAVTLLGDTLSLTYRKLRKNRHNENETERLRAEARWYLSELFR